MKSIALSILAVATVVAAIPAAASAQPNMRHYDNGPGRHHQQWQSINQRQAELDRRIDIGVRTSRLSRRETVALRAEFRDIAQLERNYRRNGLNVRERADLDRRFDRLSMKIRWEANDRDRRRGDRDFDRGYGRN